jgi:carboxymethylenebutenolidase
MAASPSSSQTSEFSRQARRTQHDTIAECLLESATSSGADFIGFLTTGAKSHYAGEKAFVSLVPLLQNEDMRTGLATCLIVITSVVCAQESLPARAKLVSFPSSGRTLYGFLYVPEGKGPFPAVLWNHGSEKRPGWQPELASFYNSHGFVFFLPHRRGQGRSPGPYIMDVIHTGGGPTVDVQAQQTANEDVVAAMKWLRTLPEVDTNRIVVSGCSFGGIQTLLTAEKGLGARAFVAFAPAAQSWGNGALDQMLKDAVEHSKAPVFILQARNDYSTQPAEVLGKIERAHGGQAKVYSEFGKTAHEGHWDFATTSAGIAVWGNDVLQFIDEAFR